LDESRIRAQLLDGSCSAVPHARPQSAHKLIDERSQLALEGHASFDAFGNQFVGAAALALAMSPAGEM